MMYIERKLWFETDGNERQSIKEHQLLERSEPLIVLGEPGMGKSRLLRKLAQDAGVGVGCFTASQIINRRDPGSLVCNRSLVIVDALDEVAAKHEGDAVDRILEKLEMLAYPRFVLSCRAADWRTATSVSAISEQYAVKPLQLHLAPLTREEQASFLAQTRGASDAERILSHFDSFGLDFLGNPQTLELVARLPAGDPLPGNRAELFEQATDGLRMEHRNSDGRSEPAKDITMDAAGAAFAGLILTGSASITCRASANLADGEIQFGEVDNLANGKLEHAIGTRLFSGGDDDFSYWHRRIGEFLGAKWLAKRADTPRKRKRLLQIFQSDGLVPANLRGLHAWLAHDKHLAPAVTTADPMGVIEYGDADSLSPIPARALLKSLERLAQENPSFRNPTRLRAGAPVRPQLNEDLHRILNDKTAALERLAPENPSFPNRTRPRAGALAQPQPQLRDDFHRILNDKTAAIELRILLAEQLLDAARAKAHAEMFREWLLDPSEAFDIRRLAGEALTHLDDENWTVHLKKLRCQANYGSVRLAFELMRRIGVASFSDDQVVVEVILAYGNPTPCPMHREDKKPYLVRFRRFSEEIPAERLDGLLETFSEFLMNLLPDRAGSEFNAIIDFIYGLILRRLEGSPIDPLKLWGWLEPCICHHVHLGSDGKKLERWLQAHDDARRAIQYHVLLDGSGKPILDKVARLSRRSAGLVPDDGDVVALLAHLDPSDRNDLRWREVLEIIPHDGELGQAARDAAKRFVAQDPQMQDWLKRLAKPRIPKWPIEQDKEARGLAAKRETEFREHRREFSKNLEKIRSGQIRWVHWPALAYLNYSDINHVVNIDGNLPAHERVADWLGADIAQAAFEGFEAFLVSKPVRRLAQNRRWNSGEIIVAALAERLRTKSELFEGLPDERLMAGVFELWHADDTGFPELTDRVEAELRRRGAWERANRWYFTPQLDKRQPHINMYRFMRSDEDADLASRLAVEWLDQYTGIAAQPEAELIDRVLASASLNQLKAIRNKRGPLINDDERRRNWDAVQVLVDFDAARRRLGTEIEPKLLWHIRDRSGRRRLEGRPAFPLSAKQIAWAVSVFRGRWPAAGRPSGLTGGDTNSWDASEFIRTLVAQLGCDVSEDAVTALTALRDATKDGYTDQFRSVAAEQKQRRVEQIYKPVTIQQIGAIINAGPPVNAADLQAVVIDALSTVQDQLRGNDVSSYKGFFREDQNHKKENPCRDELIKMLRTIEPGLEYIQESHVADDKRVDIVVRASAELILPIEVKGQWSSNFWTAADKQLDQHYINDWRAERGIYLVLWFGADPKLPAVPDGSDKPTTPEELRGKLHTLSNSARAHRLDVVVLDLTRPQPSQPNHAESPMC